MSHQKKSFYLISGLKKNPWLFSAIVLITNFWNYREWEREKARRKKNECLMCACELKKEKKSERMTKLKLARKIPNQFKWIKIEKKTSRRINKTKRKT